MRSFTHIDTETIKEACSSLNEYKAKAQLIAGGTDLLLTLKGEFLLDYPDAVINIKEIPGLDYIEEDEEKLRIGPLAKLSEIARSPFLVKKYKVLSDAAYSVATPQIRSKATIGGNLCQEVRCWYYRYPRNIGGPMQCLRKGSGPCLAVKGDNRYHAIMGAKKCYAVCPSDMAVALTALDAQITIAGPKGKRKIPVPEFYTPLKLALAPDEMVTEIEVPKNQVQKNQTFLKFTIRKPVDFAVVSVAVVITIEDGECSDARIVLGAVASGPIRAYQVEEFLIGRAINPKAASDAAELAVSDARPLSKNAYKIEILKTLIKNAILSCLC